MHRRSQAVLTGPLRKPRAPLLPATRSLILQRVIGATRGVPANNFETWLRAPASVGSLFHSLALAATKNGISKVICGTPLAYTTASIVCVSGTGLLKGGCCFSNDVDPFTSSLHLTRCSRRTRLSH